MVKCRSGHLPVGHCHGAMNRIGERKASLPSCSAVLLLCARVSEQTPTRSGSQRQSGCRVVRLGACLAT